MKPLNEYPTPLTDAHHGWADGGVFVVAMRNAVGTLAENVARDIDHFGKQHEKWYKAVNKARKLVALP